MQLLYAGLKIYSINNGASARYIMSAAKVIVRNAVFSYGRTIISAALTLFSSRWILADLGASDFGIYGLVGGLMLIVSFISSILGQGARRHIAYSIGTNDNDEVCLWFNVSANIFWALPLILVPIGLTIGEIMIRNFIRVDACRIGAALWVFRFTVISFVASLLASPYLSMLYAKQFINWVSSLMLINSVAVFITSLVLPHLPGDHLIIYAGLLALGMVCVNASYVIACRSLCPEARIRRANWWRWDRLKQIGQYTGWLSVGTVGTVVSSQGLSLLINWMRGTVANAGMSAASSLSGQMQTLSMAFLQAVSPEIIRRKGAGDHKSMVELGVRSTKLGMLLLMFVALPLFCECPYVLKLWLKNPPPYAVFFTRVVIINVLFYKLAVGHRICYEAVGKIRTQQIVELVFFSAAVPLVGISYYFTKSFEMAYCACCVTQFGYMMATAYYGGKLFGWRVSSFMAGIVMPVIAIFSFGLCLFAIFMKVLPDESFVRMVLTTIMLCAYVFMAFYSVVFDGSDRDLAMALLNRVRKITSTGD